MGVMVVTRSSVLLSTICSSTVLGDGIPPEIALTKSVIIN